MSKPNWLVVFTTNKAKGNALAALIDPAGPEAGAQTFNFGGECYPPGTTFSGSPFPVANAAPVAWVTGVRCSDVTKALALEFMSAGPYTLLNNLGITDAQVAYFREDVEAECDLFENLSERIPALIAEKGLVRV